MNNRLYFLFSIVLTLLMVASAVPSADKLNPIKLPPPQLDGGKTLMQALKARHSSRSFSDKELSNQTLSTTFRPVMGCIRDQPARNRKTNSALRT